MFEVATRKDLEAIAKAAYEYEKSSGVPLMCPALQRAARSGGVSREKWERDIVAEVDDFFVTEQSCGADKFISFLKQLHSRQINEDLVPRTPNNAAASSLITDEEYSKIWEVAQNGTTIESWDLLTESIVKRCGGKLPSDWTKRVADSGLFAKIVASFNQDGSTVVGKGAMTRR